MSSAFGVKNVDRARPTANPSGDGKTTFSLEKPKQEVKQKYLQVELARKPELPKRTYNMKKIQAVVVLAFAVSHRSLYHKKISRKSQYGWTKQK